MAVHTELTLTEVIDLVATYGIGQASAISAVAEGVENTNYIVRVAAPDDTSGDYFLTLFEEIERDELGFYIAWLNHLKHAGLPVAAPLCNLAGASVLSLREKPAALFPRLPGNHPEPVLASQCRAMGTALAQLHHASADFDLAHAGPRSPAWLEAACGELAPGLPANCQNLLQRGLAASQRVVASTMPSIPIHGDLFPDNTLFVGDRLTGLVDFVSGGNGAPLYDLAVVATAWCSASDGSLLRPLLNPLLQAYQQTRPVGADETHYWPDCLAMAALRFWVSRQLAAATQASGNELVPVKNPQIYRRILQSQLEDPCLWPTT